MNRLEWLIEQSMAWTEAANASELFHMATPVLQPLFQADGGFYLFAHADGDQVRVRVHQPFGINLGDEQMLQAEIEQGDWFYRLPHHIRLSVWAPMVEFPESWQTYISNLGISCAGVWPLQVHERVAGAVVLGRKVLPNHIRRDSRTVQLAVQQMSIVLSLISDRELAELSSMSDPLTRLPNRRGFMARWQTWRDEQSAQGERICLGILDVDQFKQINDTHGHWIGDQTLQEVAHLLLRAVSPFGMCARWGGDEFIFVVPATEATLARLKTSLAEAMPHVSFGMAIYGEDGKTFDETLMVADDRMYQLKSQHITPDHKVRRQARRKESNQTLTATEGSATADDHER